MQDKRVRLGTTDYYVHDEDGRPLFRIDVPSHDSLPVWMLNIVVHVRALVGPEDRILMAFDRGGAFPETMAALRDDDCEFVTYERAPYPKLAASAFIEELTLEDDDTVRWVKSGTNLKKGRGRVRRISVLEQDGHQVNLLASSSLPAERLISVMRGRWQQENAGRRLDIARRAANIREGDARNLLVRYPEGHRHHDAALREIEEALREEREIDALRPTVPKHARLADTELAGKLVRHDGKRKLVLDTIRIACANVEADLAQILAGYMNKPREAKHLLANVFRSPGNVPVGTTTISVDLAPAATPSERAAIADFLRDLTTLRSRCQATPGVGHSDFDRNLSERRNGTLVRALTRTLPGAANKLARVFFASRSFGRWGASSATSSLSTLVQAMRSASSPIFTRSTPSPSSSSRMTARTVGGDGHAAARRSSGAVGVTSRRTPSAHFLTHAIAPGQTRATAKNSPPHHTFSPPPCPGNLPRFAISRLRTDGALALE
jgi:hypothetical protein